MEYVMHSLNETELLEIYGGFNWEYFSNGVAAVGVVAALFGCAPVAVVCGVYEASYWFTKAVVN